MANCSDCFNFGDCLQYEGTKYYGLDAACDNVEELCENFKNKADFVEVVRCKDCLQRLGKINSCGGVYCNLHKGYFDKDGNFISVDYGKTTIKPPSNAYYVAFNIANAIIPDTNQRIKGYSPTSLPLRSPIAIANQ